MGTALRVVFAGAQFDATGNLITKTDRNGNAITYVYDALNRLTHKGYPDSTGVDYIYDLVGKIKSVTDPTGSYGFAYDNMGRLIGTSTQYSFLPGQTYTNNYTYDAASNRTGFTAPDGSTNTYGYDNLNRLTSLTNSLTGQFGFGYDVLSRRTSLTRPNGVNTSYSYDSLSRLLSVLHQNGATTIDGATYTLDSAGNRTSKQNWLNGITENYTYDPIYQLTQLDQLVNGNTSTTESYTYDAVGNRCHHSTWPATPFIGDLRAKLKNQFFTGSCPRFSRAGHRLLPTGLSDDLCGGEVTVFTSELLGGPLPANNRSIRTRAHQLQAIFTKPHNRRITQWCQANLSLRVNMRPSTNQ